MTDLQSIPVPQWLSHLRRFPLDGALLLFDRETGLNARCEGEETRHLRMVAPRVVQFGITNRCNLACSFCSRDLDAASDWDVDSAFTVLAELADQGVLEVAFGGGEPFVFKGFSSLVRRLWNETPLAVNVTTNGLALNRERLREIVGHLGELRVSLYEDNAWRETLQLLVSERARFGVNWLVTPQSLDTLEARVFELVALGCRDVLLLSYNGEDRALHLRPEQVHSLSTRVQTLSRALSGRCELKLDVCWGERMEAVPRLFTKADCGAGREFIVLTSDRRLMPCSFHHLGFEVRSAADVMRYWTEARGALASAARAPGCARTPGFGLSVPCEERP
jgi:MoaA/NifB/PqqE/SkfB family radical SAM enzyme